MDYPGSSYMPLEGDKCTVDEDAENIVAETGAACSGSTRPQVRRRPPLTIDARTKSDFGSVSRSFKIGTIAEDFQQAHNEYIPIDESPGSAASHHHYAVPGREVFPNTNSRHSPKDSLQRYSSSQGTPLSQIAVLSETPLTKTPSEKRPSISWRRTLSGGILFERSSSGKNISLSSHEASPGRESTEPVSAIKPLRPPPSLHLTNFSSFSEHNVRVETPFSQPEETRIKQTSSSDDKRIKSKSTIDPRDLFPSYIGFIRRFGKWKVKEEPAAIKVFRGGTFFKGHKTAWRRDNITSALHRVSSLLSDIRSIRSGDRSWSDHSPSTGSSKAATKDLCKDQTSKQPIPVERVHSMEMVSNTESEDSSLLKLRIGLQPPNTPNEQATYRVKRSPSADTEEFLKIDISVRGGTSYLPSEARRIHTPPLPREGPGGKRRGFFFDYNATRHHQNQEHTKFSQTRTASTIDRLSQDMKVEQKDRGHTVDWYGLQLRELDRLDTDNLQSQPSETPSRSSTILAQHFRRQQEEEMDYSIPEHLPSSPLCPRHPRYWRIMKSQGCQYRGCWLHGVGLWEDDMISAHAVSTLSKKIVNRETNFQQ